MFFLLKCMFSKKLVKSIFILYKQLFSITYNNNIKYYNHQNISQYINFVNDNKNIKQEKSEIKKRFYTLTLFLFSLSYTMVITYS